jgi:tetratricopeptide (TPR) repeat protein
MFSSGVHRLFRALDAEREAGEGIAQALLGTDPSTWGELISAHPHWLRFGTLEFLVHAAECRVHSNPKRTCTMTAFILTYIVHMPTPSEAELLVDSVTAHAWIVHGMALLELGDHAGALDASGWARAQSGDRPALALDGADAELLRARVYARTGRERDALDALNSCMTVFRDFGDALRYGEVLTERAVLLVRIGLVPEARISFQFAEELLRSVGDLRADAILATTIFDCPELVDVCSDSKQVARFPITD